MVGVPSDWLKDKARQVIAWNALNDACMLAARSAFKVLKQQGQPQFVAVDPEQFEKELVFLIGMTMTEALSRRTGQGQ